jgi:hypothetical protein
MKTALKNSITNQFIELGRMFRISAKDVRTVYEVVNDLQKLDAVNSFLTKHFLQDIKAGHFYLAGYLIGHNQATEQALDEILNNIQLCQRQN